MMRIAVAFDFVVAIKLLLTRRQRMALKGPDVIAQGEALGRAPKPGRALKGRNRDRFNGETWRVVSPHALCRPFRAGICLASVSQGFALGYLIRPFQGRVPTSCLQRLDCDQVFSHKCAEHRLW